MSSLCLYMILTKSPWLQAVKRHYGDFAKLDTSLKVVFEKGAITLDIPEDGIIHEGWKITPKYFPVVSM